MQYQFDAELAMQYGVDEAIFVHRIYWWVRQNRATGRNYRDGHYWTHDSVQALISADVFGFWTRRQLERIVKSCCEQGLILTADYNTDRRARPMWYTVTDKVLQFYEHCAEPSAAPEPPEESISPNGELDSTKRGNAFHQTVESTPPNGELYYKEQLVDTVSRQRECARARATPPARKEAPELKTYGEFGHVKLSDADLSKLLARWSERQVRDAIDALDGYLENNPKKHYANHYATLRNWLRRDYPDGAGGESGQIVDEGWVEA